jgi:Tol biopolymer transport system component
MKRFYSVMAVILAILLTDISYTPLSSAHGKPGVLMGYTARVSLSSAGIQANHSSVANTISADGRYIVFSTHASNLVDGDTNNYSDVFMHDRITGETTRVSIASDGTQGNSDSMMGSISADNRYVAFVSASSNLVTGDTNGRVDIFVHDRENGMISRVSIATSRAEANDFSWDPKISADGRFIAFHSYATNLVEGDTNERVDIFVHERLLGITTRVSVASDGSQGEGPGSDSPSISADGRYVAFAADFSNLVPGDTNETSDVFVHDRASGQTMRVSVASDGTQGNGGSGYPSISGDGRYVTFTSFSTNLVDNDFNSIHDVFLHDRQTGETRLVSISSDGTQGNYGADYARISGDGRFVSFDSSSDNLVVPDTNFAQDVFIHNLMTGETTRISIATDGSQGDDNSGISSLSSDGRYVVFTSESTNLVTGDNNLYCGYGFIENCLDAFVRDRESEVASFSITGHASDSSGNPLSDVSIDTGFGYVAVTDVNGNYILPGLPSGTYQITASRSDMTMLPAYWETSVPPERWNINFIQGYLALLPFISR